MRREALALAALLVGAALGIHVPAPSAATGPAPEVVAASTQAHAPPRASVALPTAPPGSNAADTDWRVLPGTRDLDLAVRLPASGARALDNGSTPTATVFAPDGSVALRCDNGPCKLHVATPMAGVWRLEPGGPAAGGTLAWTPGPMAPDAIPLYGATLQAGDPRTDFFLVDRDTPTFTLSVQHPVPIPGVPTLPSATLTAPDDHVVGSCSGNCRLTVGHAPPGWWKVAYASELPLQAAAAPSN